MQFDLIGYDKHLIPAFLLQQTFDRLVEHKRRTLSMTLTFHIMLTQLNVN